MLLELTARADDDGRRLDRILRKALPNYSLSLIHRLLRQKRILVDGNSAQGSQRVRSGQIITVPPDALPRPPPFTLPPSHLSPLPIVYESPSILILNKPRGLAVHGPDSLDTLVQAYLAGKTAPSISFRPGPLHRLDKPSSGLIVFSKSLAGARFFSGLMQEGKIKKQYLAIAEGLIEKKEVWDDELERDRTLKKTFAGAHGGRIKSGENGPKRALTAVTPLARYGGYTFILAEISTGRTHQIRAQAAFHGHPLSGDKKYGGLPESAGFFLHARKLEFLNPAEDAADGPDSLPAFVTAEVPLAFRKRIEELFPLYYNSIECSGNIS
jgi:23S rRNA pseudouridine955/2504/2580 synthase